MNANDRIALLDLENLGTVRLRPRPLRARLEALMAAAGDVHHAAAAYAVADATEADPIASVLAELRIAPLRVPPGPDAAELALVAHARHVHAEGGRTFIVGSADGRFAELDAAKGGELLVWHGQPVATKLADVVHDIHRLPRPTGTPVDDTADQASCPVAPAQQADGDALVLHHTEPRLVVRVLTALATGVGIALGHRLADTLLRRTKR